MSTVTVQLPESLHEQARALAEKERISLDQLIALALAEKLSALETVDYLQERAKRGDREKFLRALQQVPDVEPEEHDRL